MQTSLGATHTACMAAAPLPCRISRATQYQQLVSAANRPMPVGMGTPDHGHTCIQSMQHTHIILQQKDHGVQELAVVLPVSVLLSVGSQHPPTYNKARRQCKVQVKKICPARLIRNINTVNQTIQRISTFHVCRNRELQQSVKLRPLQP